jgi:hypothetical protein
MFPSGNSPMPCAVVLQVEGRVVGATAAAAWDDCWYVLVEVAVEEGLGTICCEENNQVRQGHFGCLSNPACLPAQGRCTVCPPTIWGGAQCVCAVGPRVTPA